MKSFVQLLYRHGGEYLILLLALGLHTACISLPGRSAKLASSNLMTNLSRMEDLRQLTPETVALAGSSITGRLLAENFSPATGRILNVGLDGCGSLEALTALSRQPTRPSVIVIEINSLRPGYATSYLAVLDGLTPLRSQVASVLPFLRVNQRPLDVLYDFTRTLKQPRTPAGQLSWNDAIRVTAASLPSADATPTDYLDSARALLHHFHEAGSRLLFVLIPDSQLHDPQHDPSLQRALNLAGPLDAPVFDLRQATGAETLSWTDGVHLTATAAQTVARFLETELLPQAK